MQTGGADHRKVRSHLLQGNKNNIPLTNNHSLQGCISECVNRQHECPECRAKLTKDDLFRNYSLEKLLERLSEERDKE